MDEVRARLMVLLGSQDYETITGPLVVKPSVRVDAILAEIEAAGYVIWPKDRAERMRDACQVAWNQTRLGPLVPSFPGPHMLIYPAIDALEPGDLDPLP